ncbi:MAG: DUF2007-related protein [Methanosarcina sp.]
MKTDNQFESVEIYSGTDWQAQMVKNLLENEGINAYIKNEIIGTIAPWYITPGAGSVSVFISSQDYERAKAIVEEYEKNNKD